MEIIIIGALALWFYTLHHGRRCRKLRPLLHHIGKTNWQNPIPINPQAPQALITEIEETTDAIVALTMPKP